MSITSRVAQELSHQVAPKLERALAPSLAAPLQAEAGHLVADRLALGAKALTENRFEQLGKEGSLLLAKDLHRWQVTHGGKTFALDFAHSGVRGLRGLLPVMEQATLRVDGKLVGKALDPQRHGLKDEILAAFTAAAAAKPEGPKAEKLLRLVQDFIPARPNRPWEERVTLVEYALAQAEGRISKRAEQGQARFLRSQSEASKRRVLAFAEAHPGQTTVRPEVLRLRAQAPDRAYERLVEEVGTGHWSFPRAQHKARLWGGGGSRLLALRDIGEALKEPWKAWPV